MPTVADTDIYIGWKRNHNGEEYHELLLVYVDDLLCCSHNTQLTMIELDLTYDMKDRLVGPPKIHLRAKIEKYQVKSGKSHCIISST